MDNPESLHLFLNSSGKNAYPGDSHIDFLCDVFNAELAADVLTVADVEKATGLTGI